MWSGSESPASVGVAPGALVPLWVAGANALGPLATGTIWGSPLVWGFLALSVTSVVLALGWARCAGRLSRAVSAGGQWATSRTRMGQEDRASLLLDVAGVLLVALDRRGRITLLNQKGHEILGYGGGELIGRDWFATCIPEEERSKVRREFERLMLGQVQPVEHFDNAVLTKSNDRRQIAWHNTLLLSESGEITGTFSSGEDVTERRRFEKERESLIEKLEAQNAELERFTYMVSHDLKSPLITVKGYMGLLRQDLGAGDLAAAEDDIVRMSSAADRMESLLGELLELSRIGRLTRPTEDLSLGDLAREAVELVAGRIAERGVAIEIADDLPVVHGDRPRLVEVLQNLVDNAVKYMGDQLHPRIEIGARSDDGQPVCYVRDNGVGIEPRYHEQVFGLFNKLDPRSEGVGAGLALAKRIVEVHKGRIWVESQGAGRGATFCFFIPRHGTVAGRKETDQ